MYRRCIAQPVRAGVIVLAFALVVLNTACRTGGPPAKRPPSYPGAAVVDVNQIKFDDGDTFVLEGTPIRFLGIDTPEIRDPGVGIDEDQPFGRAAAESTRVWILRAHVVEIAFDGRDRYNRRLAHIFIDGELLAVRLLQTGLAYETISHYGDNGFPDLADRILQAAEEGPKPAFEEPYRWRRKHQRRPAGAGR
jgi:endonuclease YncB( thermonuclease family)